MLECGWAWLGGDQLQVSIRSSTPDPVSDVALRIEFGSGDTHPWAVYDGISGFYSDGRLIVDTSALSPDSPVTVLMVVPRQHPRSWHLSWTADDGAEHENSGQIE